MEEIRLYIESGTLELYATGGLNAEEREEAEAMLAKHPSLHAELVEIEKSLEKYAQSYAIEPSDKLRDRIIGNILTSAVHHTNSDVPTEPKVRKIASNQNTFYKYAFAASVALLFLSLAALVVMNSRLRETNQQLALIQNTNQQYSSRVNYLNNQLNTKETVLSVLRNPEFKMVKLAGTKQAPSASMTVAFNSAKKEVMIDMASLEMPAHDQEHQYQLWALVDGKPVDLGVFSVNSEDNGMIKMKDIAAAQAFAVTLELRGGSINPTMEQMMVMGAI